MFSTGQTIFVIFFVLVFTGLLILSYRKDKKLHKKYYKGSIWILLGFIAFIILLFLLKDWLKA
jgi:uncharacterized membrane protein